MTRSSVEKPEWSVFEEIRLFQALRHNKPVGVNKHFAIIKLVDEFNSSINKQYSISEVWNFLSTMYNIDALDDFESVPFPNEVVDFSLPESDFPDVISDVASESDVRNSVADSLDLEQSLADVKGSKSRADRSAAEDGTPKRPPKRTRASAANTPTSESSFSVKRRRV